MGLNIFKLWFKTDKLTLTYRGFISICMLFPVVRYAWYRILADHVLPKETSQNLTFSSVRAHHAGQYYCTAWNQLGYQSSIVATLAVLCESRMRSVFNLMIMAHFIYPANWNSQQGMTSPPSCAFSKNVTNLSWLYCCEHCELIPLTQLSYRCNTVA